MQINDVDMIFDDQDLASVITLQEVMFLWGLSRRQVQWAIWRDQVQARKSLTGGQWLISYESALSHFGKPERSISEFMV